MKLEWNPATPFALFLDVAKGAALVKAVRYDASTANEVHARYGGRLSYVSRSGLTGEGFVVDKPHLVPVKIFRHPSGLAARPGIYFNASEEYWLSVRHGAEGRLSCCWSRWPKEVVRHQFWIPDGDSREVKVPVWRWGIGPHLTHVTVEVYGHPGRYVLYRDVRGACDTGPVWPLEDIGTDPALIALWRLGFRVIKDGYGQPHWLVRYRAGFPDNVFDYTDDREFWRARGVQNVAWAGDDCFVTCEFKLYSFDRPAVEILPGLIARYGIERTVRVYRLGKITATQVRELMASAAATVEEQERLIARDECVPVGRILRWASSDYRGLENLFFDLEVLAQADET